MKETSSFNLIDHPWIPVVDSGRKGLKEIFENREYKAIGGNPVQKIAVLKLLQAIAMRAAPLANEESWAALGPEEMGRKCLAYLEKWHDRFFLYGERPFLQMPAVEKAEVQSYGAMLPEIATGNTTILTQWHKERHLDDGERALLLVSLMGFAFSGKKVDNSVILTPGYSGKKKSARPAPALAFRGLLHSFLLGKDILTTVWLNMLTREEVENWGVFESGIGVPPWENMPKGEACEVAEGLKTSLIGRLVPLSRFCLLKPTGLHYSEGLQYMNYADGVYDPSIAVNARAKKIKALWTEPEKRPWRQLPSLLSFIRQGGGDIDCFQLRACVPRAIRHVDSFGIWTGGLKVSSNAGEQYVSGKDDFVESEVWLSSHMVNEIWFNNLQTEMKNMEDMAKLLYACINAYFDSMKSDGKAKAAQGVGLFWELCEYDFQELVDACAAREESKELLEGLRRRFAHRVNEIYNRFCPNETARQMEAWAQCRPGLGKFFKGETP